MEAHGRVLVLICTIHILELACLHNIVCASSGRLDFRLMFFPQPVVMWACVHGLAFITDLISMPAVYKRNIDLHRDV